MTDVRATDDRAELPTAAFAFPGPLRDRLVRAILDGHKVTTTSLALANEVEGAPLPRVGGRSVVLDSNERPVCVIETVEVRVVAPGDVDYDHADGEGEGYASVAEWRASHEDFWRGPEMLESLGRRALVLDDATPVVVERFRVVDLDGVATSSL